MYSKKIVFNKEDIKFYLIQYAKYVTNSHIDDFSAMDLKTIHTIFKYLDIIDEAHDGFIESNWSVLKEIIIGYGMTSDCHVGRFTNNIKYANYEN